MKKSYIKILMLTPLFVLTGCKHSSNKAVTITPVQQTNPTEEIKFDTLRVIGTYDISANGEVHTINVGNQQIGNSSIEAYKFLRCVDKYGNETDLTFNTVHKPMKDFAYVQRGDTIIMQGKEFIKNISQERLKSEFVKGR